jgi:hypothetical protein
LRALGVVSSAAIDESAATCTKDRLAGTSRVASVRAANCHLGLGIHRNRRILLRTLLHRALQVFLLAACFLAIFSVPRPFALAAGVAFRLAHCKISADGAILATALGVLRTALLSKQLHEVAAAVKFIFI